YLGLALAQKGDLARAREWFLKAGNDAMAERMDQALQESPIREVAQGAEAALAQDQPFKPAVDAAPALPKKKRDTLEMAKPVSLAADASPDPAPVNTPPLGTRWVATSPGAAAPAPPVAPQAEATPAGRIVPNVPEPSQPPAAS